MRLGQSANRVLAGLAVAVAFAPAAGASANDTDSTGAVTAGVYRGVTIATRFDVSPPLRSMPPLPIKPKPRTGPEELWTGLEGPPGPQSIDPLVQSRVGPGEIPAPSASFDGPGNIANVSPPDPVGDVGPSHYVAMSNLYFAVYDKAGLLLYGPAANNTLWAGFGGPCQTENAGDPVVLHDQLADRWILTQFTANGPTYYNCVAISTSADPMGTYYRYAFSTGTNFPDYPKYGVWSDAYYISTREFAGASTFAGVGAYALNRDQMIAGNPAAQVISFLVPPGGTPYNIGDGLLPADLDGSTLPPPGSPEFYLGSMDQGGPYGAPQDALTLWKFHVDFATPANSTFTLAGPLPVAGFDSIFPCAPSARSCIPQPATAQKVDILSYRQRLMHRLAYRNLGTHESLVANQSVEAVAGMAGIRWYEVRDPDGDARRLSAGHLRAGSDRRHPPLDGLDRHGRGRRHRARLQRFRRAPRRSRASGTPAACRRTPWARCPRERAASSTARARRRAAPGGGATTRRSTSIPSTTARSGTSISTFRSRAPSAGACASAASSFRAASRALRARSRARSRSAGAACPWRALR